MKKIASLALLFTLFLTPISNCQENSDDESISWTKEGKQKKITILFNSDNTYEIHGSNKILENLKIDIEKFKKNILKLLINSKKIISIGNPEITDITVDLDSELLYIDVENFGCVFNSYKFNIKNGLVDFLFKISNNDPNSKNLAFANFIFNKIERKYSGSKELEERKKLREFLKEKNISFVTYQLMDEDKKMELLSEMNKNENKLTFRKLSDNM